MKAMLRQLAIAGIIGFVLCAPIAARADDDGDHDRARDLYERGEIKGLHDILRIVGERAPGDIVAVDLIRLGEKWVYRFEIVDSSGRRTLVDVDAGEAKVMGEGADD